MTESIYAVGHGRPPVHSRFKKGQSANPSGRPGPEKLSRGHFLLALERALAANARDLEGREPAHMLEKVANQLVLRAAGGDLEVTAMIWRLAEIEGAKRRLQTKRLMRAAQREADNAGCAGAYLPDT